MEYTVENTPVEIKGAINRIEEYVNTSEKFDEETRTILTSLINCALLESSAKAMAQLTYDLMGVDKDKILENTLEFYQDKIDKDIHDYQNKNIFKIINGGLSESD